MTSKYISTLLGARRFGLLLGLDVMPVEAELRHCHALGEIQWDAFTGIEVAELLDVLALDAEWIEVERTVAA